MSFVTSWYGIQNEYGQQIDLGYDQPVRFSNPAGFGLSSSLDFADIDNGFFRLVNKKYEQAVITGDLQFRTDAFAKYRSLVDYMMKASQLYFMYKPQDTIYYRKVELVSIEKGIRNGRGIMEAQITFNAVTPWYTAADVVISASGESAAVSLYDVERYDVGAFSDNNGTDYEAIVNATGHFPAAFVARFTGSAESPTITLTGEDTGTVYGKLVLNDYTKPSGGKIEYSTEQDDSHIYYIADDGEKTDLISYVDITQNAFPHIPVSERCILKMSAPSILDGNLTVTLKNYFRSV